MRTTLTLDDDVAAMLRHLQKEQGTSFKQLVNDALRRGAESMSEKKPREGKQYTFPVRSLGPPLVDVTDISEVLAMLDHEDDKRMIAGLYPYGPRKDNGQE
jgi:hypothetical protein